MKYFLLGFNLLFIHKLIAASEVNFKKFMWNDIEVYWVQDDGFPSYTVSIYFADGALSDQTPRFGETEYMFSGLINGTRRYSQQQIVDHLDYFGTRYGHQVTHEYSSFSYGGLARDIVPTTKMFCHLFKDAIYPAHELNNQIKRAQSDLKNIVSNHSALASMALRRISLRDTPYEYPAEGTIHSLSKIKSESLIQKRERFNSDVKKIIYITGPKKILEVENVFKSDCKWSGDSIFVRSQKPVQLKQSKQKIVLVPVPQANQAQIRIGGYFDPNILTEKKLNLDHMTFLSSLLGGNFSSLLVQELRVKRGLTYSASSFLIPQKNYARSALSTFVPTDSTVEAIEVIKQVIDNVAQGKVSPDKFVSTKRYLAGSYLFQFETSELFLSQLQYYQHIGRDFNEILKFVDSINKMSEEEIQHLTGLLLPWDQLVIVIVGDQKLKQVLQKLGKVEVLSYSSLI